MSDRGPWLKRRPRWCLVVLAVSMMGVGVGCGSKVDTAIQTSKSQPEESQPEESQPVFANDHKALLFQVDTFTQSLEDQPLYTIIGTITKVRVKDISKTIRVKNEATYITLSVEETSPPELIDQLSRDAQDFLRRTVKGVDEHFAVGQRVRIVTGDVFDPRLLGIREITSL